MVWTTGAKMTPSAGTNQRPSSPILPSSLTWSAGRSTAPSVASERVPPVDSASRPGPSTGGIVGAGRRRALETVRAGRIEHDPVGRGRCRGAVAGGVNRADRDGLVTGGQAAELPGRLAGVEETGAQLALEGGFRIRAREGDCPGVGDDTAARGGIDGHVRSDAVHRPVTGRRGRILDADRSNRTDRPDREGMLAFTDFGQVDRAGAGLPGSSVELALEGAGLVGVELEVRAGLVGQTVRAAVDVRVRGAALDAPAVNGRIALVAGDVAGDDREGVVAVGDAVLAKLPSQRANADPSRLQNRPSRAPVPSSGCEKAR